MAFHELKKDDQSKVLLLTDRNSLSGTAFLKSVGAIYSVSEYRMRLLHNQEPEPASFITLKKAKLTDRFQLKEMNRHLFQDRPETEGSEEEDSDLITIDSTYLIYHKDQFIGKICIDLNDSYAFIYGFGILSEFRGQGLGTIALQKSVSLIRSMNIQTIELDVSATNDRALHIYVNCGFVKQSVMDYYELGI